MNRVNRGLTLLLFQFIFTGTLFSQEIAIWGNEPHYAGCKITFYRFTERIAYTRDELGSCIVDNQGDFMIRFQAGYTTQVFADVGIYTVYLFTEPGKEYHVKLPPRMDKKTADYLNPYFRKELVHLGILNHEMDELNGKIYRFDTLFAPLFHKYSFGAYIQNQFSDLDSTLQALNYSVGNAANPYFRCYVGYKSALLKEMISEQRTNLSIPVQNYSTNILYQNPAFFDWFQQVYNNYFQYLNRLDPVQFPLYEIIEVKRSYPMLLELFNENKIFPNDTVTELIVIKGLYDEYFSDKFSDRAILEILDSLINGTPYKEHSMMAEKIKRQITRLRIGCIPPDFKLPTFENDTLTLKDLAGKYVYLNFCTPWSPSCREHFDLLKLIQEKYENALEVVTVSIDENNSRMKVLVKEMDLSWRFLDSQFESEILESYDIRVFPTYYLIDPGGRLLLSPAPAPDNGFERSFLGILKKRGNLDF